MFDDEERTRIREEVEQRVASDRVVLDDLIDMVRKHGLRRNARQIQNYKTAALAIVASDGGNHQLKFDPFHQHLIRVVDSDGQTLGLKSIALTTSLESLFASEFTGDDGKPTPVGRLILDLRKATGTSIESYHDLCSSINDRQPDRIEGNIGWVVSYRDLWEWAVLYCRIMYADFAQSTMILRDGLLRTKLFAKNYFRVIGDLLAERFDHLKRRERKDVFLVGLAKSSSVIDRFRLALAMEDVFPAGYPYYVAVPRDMERRAYNYPEFSWGRDRLPRNISGPHAGFCATRDPATGRLALNFPGGGAKEDSKYVFGSMFLVRFGPDTHIPMWAVDLFDDQIGQAERVIGHLYADSTDSFPVPCYPYSLQRAHEAAKLTDLDVDILNDAVLTGIRRILGADDVIVDRITLAGDVTGRRY